MRREGGGMGGGGFCVCVKCGYKKPHTPGVPCQDERCPNCGSVLLREGSYHYNQAKEVLEKKRKKNSDEKNNLN
ncbi:ferredoxin [Petrotoga sp. HWH.PT.55.6.1]|jgi:NAD-dependent SIR2 family protein deacetylase|uniref:ferredoxin n=1 Tax=unclassified Petrotoga TaxID=2620614 RepID=UPI000CA00945|nr:MULTISPECIES: ferredoxin [unclassified Petrotoga]MBL5982153.1 ferredoxin [Petrotoga sp. 8T1HF07.NaAc.6.1]RLL84494.1 ferredoxin [Petrotoga sp. Shatin.DS.tank11.9.2.9.3]RLL89622.1 ferredoxin [Petrotoga sp. HKA.pet.4.5]RPD35081.1 ferredoxin [Petrotoga sp. HWH.PT.55.6.1]